MNVDTGHIFENISEIPLLSEEDLLHKKRLTKLTEQERQAIKNIKPAEGRPEMLAWYRWKNLGESNPAENSLRDAFLAGFRAAKEWGS